MKNIIKERLKKGARYSLFTGLILSLFTLHSSPFTAHALTAAGRFLAINTQGPPSTPVITANGDYSLDTIIVTKTSGGVPATSYDVKWGTSSGNRSNTISGASLPYSHTGRTAGTPYYYSVVANNASGSTESSEATATPTFNAQFAGSTVPFDNYWPAQGGGQTNVAGKLHYYHATNAAAPYANVNYTRSNTIQFSFVSSVTNPYNWGTRVYLNASGGTTVNYNAYMIMTEYVSDTQHKYTMYKYVNGGESTYEAGSNTFTFSATDTYTWKIYFSGDTIKLDVSVNGGAFVNKLSHLETAGEKSAGQHTAFTKLSFLVGSTNTIDWDDVSVQ